MHHHLSRSLLALLVVLSAGRVFGAEKPAKPAPAAQTATDAPLPPPPAQAASGTQQPPPPARAGAVQGQNEQANPQTDGSTANPASAAEKDAAAAMRDVKNAALKDLTDGLKSGLKARFEKDLEKFKKSLVKELSEDLKKGLEEEYKANLRATMKEPRSEAPRLTESRPIDRVAQGAYCSSGAM